MRQLELSYTTGGNENCTITLENFGAVFLKVKHTPTKRPSDSTTRYLPKSNENICPYKDFYVDVHCIFIHSSQKLETIQMSINWGTEKQNVVYLEDSNSVIKRNELLTSMARWMNLKILMLSQKSQIQKCL